jgi:hypothetical protein
MAAKAVRELFRTDPVLSRFTGAEREAHVERLSGLWRKWQEANAATVEERVRRGFLEHVRLSSLPAAQLTEDQKEFKAA